MPITGLDQVKQLLAGLARLPEQAAAAAKDHYAGVRVSESTRGLFTQHRVGRRIVAVTLPAVGKTAWISVLDPKQGTSRGGDRKRISTQEEALKHSRDHTLEVASAQADRLQAREWDRAQEQIDVILKEL